MLSAKNLRRWPLCCGYCRAKAPQVGAHFGAVPFLRPGLGSSSALIASCLELTPPWTYCVLSWRSVLNYACSSAQFSQDEWLPQFSCGNCELQTPEHKNAKKELKLQGVLNQLEMWLPPGLRQISLETDHIYKRAIIDLGVIMCSLLDNGRTQTMQKTWNI